MRRNGEHDGRAFAEILLAGMALCALMVPIARADGGRIERRARAAALGLEVLAHVAVRPGTAAGEAFRTGSGSATPIVPRQARRDHRVLGPRGENPLALPPGLASELVNADLEARLYLHRQPHGAQVAWVDVLDARVTRASGDPLAALLAHRSLRIIVPPAAAGQVEVRDASL